MTVINIEEHYPHVVITTNKDVHVVPLQYFNDYLNGKVEFNLGDDILKVIVREWSKTLKIT